MGRKLTAGSVSSQFDRRNSFRRMSSDVVMSMNETAYILQTESRASLIVCMNFSSHAVALTSDETWPFTQLLDGNSDVGVLKRKTDERSNTGLGNHAIAEILIRTSHGPSSSFIIDGYLPITPCTQPCCDAIMKTVD